MPMNVSRAKVRVHNHKFTNMANYNCDTLGDHLLLDCNDTLEGGGDQIVLLESGHGITDFENATQINDAITAGTAHLFTGQLINMPAASPLTRASYQGGVPDRTYNYDRTLSIMDVNVNYQNDDLLETFNNGWQAVGFIYKLAQESKVFAIDGQTINLYGFPVAEDNDTVRYEMTLQWRSRTNPKVYDEASGVFS